MITIKVYIQLINIKKTNGFTADEFKSQIDSQVKLDMDDNNAIVNGFEFKFGNYEYTFIIKGGLLRMCSRIEQKKRSRKNGLLFFTVFLNK